MPDYNCRLSKLEQAVENYEEKFTTISERLIEIKTTLDSQQGFVRGIVFTVTAITGGIGLALNYWGK